MSGSSPLVEWIVREIESNGPISFRDFMELALYHPEWGYYSQPERAVGRKGDFYTSVSVGPVFGELLARQFEQAWRELGRPSSFTIIEQGAHSGRFALDVLSWTRTHAPDFFACLEYRFVEPLASRRKQQQQTLHSFDQKTNWVSILNNIPDESQTGIFFSNELVDSFPVHRVTFSNNQWTESFVAWNGSHFVFEERGITNPELTEVLQKIPGPLPAPYQTEINLAARNWIRQVGQKLKQGFVITVDYGYPEDQFFDPARQTGTLLCYHQHRKNEEPLERVGEQDITTHVDFSALARAGKKAGLEALGFTDQNHFLMGLAAPVLLEWEKAGMANDAATSTRIRALKTLLHPEMMGSRFHFLVQTKALLKPSRFDGLQFQRPFAL